MISKPYVIASGVAAVLLSACSPEVVKDPPNSPVEAAEPIASSAQPVVAESTLASLLRLAVPTRKPDMTLVDSITTCGMEENLEHHIWLAAWQFDSVRKAVDSVEVFAHFTAVARGRLVGGRMLSTFGVEEIPVAVQMVRQGRWWKVCMDFYDPRRPTDHFSIGGMPGPRTHWQTNGATSEKALAAIDSIRLARHLGIIR